ncbi:MAG: DUF6483 family protein [Anaerovoracaceae bacterium]
MQRDYIMNEIEKLSRFLTQVMFNRKAPFLDMEYGETTISNKTLLWFNLRRMTEAGEINEAENMLFETINNANKSEKYQLLNIATKFYEELNKFSDEELISNNFTRDEIENGIQEINKLYGAII